MAVESPVVPKTRRWKRVEYERLVELGIFQPDERLELLDGLLVVREPQGSRHAAAIRAVVRTLRRVLGDAWQIDSQLPIALDDDSEPEPDVAVVPADPHLYRAAHPSRPVLVVEVSEGSYRIDRRFKAALYARASVADYWLVDVVHETVEIHRQPEPSRDTALGWRYGSVEVLRAPATVSPLIAPTSSTRVADLLP